MKASSACVNNTSACVCVYTKKEQKRDRDEIIIKYVLLPNFPVTILLKCNICD